MKRTFAVLAAVVLGLLVSAGQAMAQAPGGSAEQALANAAGSAQSAQGLAGALQGSPSNTNTAAPAVSPSTAPATSPSTAPATSPSTAPAASPSAAPAASPSTAGSVSQSNTVIGGSVAANGNSTTQTANQNQAGGSGTQTTGQIASNDQSAVSSADAAQLGAANDNIDVRVFSPGNGGSVSQANTVLAGSLAGNHNKTKQTADQKQAGGPGSGSQQTVGQAAANKQDADSYADAKQDGAKNSNISVRIFSSGDDGSVEQSNTVAGIAAALNGNSTDQTATQGSSGGGSQTALQGAINHQGAKSSADAEQKGAKNENIAVRIFSPGKGGSVSQSNTAIAGSLAANGNATKQTATQSQGGGYGSSEQVVGQAAANHQDAWSDADATQYGASNTNIPIRIFSDGDDGAVEQSNTVLGLSAALNGNETTQTATQNQTGAAPKPYAVKLPYPDSDPYSDYDKQYPEKDKQYPEKDKKDAGPGVQAIGQIAESKQDAVAKSDATQIGASNTNVPVRIGSEGDAGSVSQANTTISAAIAVNKNETPQTAIQNQSGHGTLVQGIAQGAKNKQGALAFSDALQKDATNTNAPVDVFGKGDHKDDKYDKYDKYDKKDMNDHKADAGSVSQSNTAAAIGVALNGNSTTQTATQNQAGGSPLVQAVGQWAENDQFALGKGDAYQRDVANSNTPIVIGHDFDKHKCEYRKERCERKEPPKCDSKCEPKYPEPKYPEPRYPEPKNPEPTYPEPTYPVEPKCDWKKDSCESKRPVEPKCDWKKDECKPKHHEPPKCEPRMPKYEPCDKCERPDYMNCPDRRWEAN